jgi:hypothetical protein
MLRLTPIASETFYKAKLKELAATSLCGATDGVVEDF